MNKDDTTTSLTHWHNFRIKIVFEGILVGFFSGIVIVGYRYTLEKALSFSKYVYSQQLKHLWLIPIWFILLILGGLAVGIIVQEEPMSSGSGIPQVEGVLLRKLNMEWWRVILAKFVGGAICIGAGLSLGREGPSIQMGAAVGQGFSRLSKRIKMEEKFLITSGASAGLAAAFNAPLAGVIFALEEVHKNFSPIVLTSALAASLTADFMSKHFFGLTPMFDFKHITPIPLNSYLYLIVLGVIIGILGVLFNKSLLKTQDLYTKQKWLPSKARPVVAFLAAGIVGLFLPDVLGGGHEIIVSAVSTSIPLKFLIVILIVKFLFTMISYGSSAPGGIFLPLLVIGALIGVIYGNIMHIVFGFSDIYIVNLVILAMAGYFTAIVKAPITGCILITEMTGSFSHLLSVGLVCLTSYTVADLLNSKPIYEVLLERFLKKGTNEFKGNSDTKVIIETAVYMGSILEGKKVKDMQWPSNCLLVGIKRGEVELIPKGDTQIYAGDYLIVLTNENLAAEVRECLAELGERCGI